MAVRRDDVVDVRIERGTNVASNEAMSSDAKPRFVLLAAIDTSAASDRIVSVSIGFLRMMPGAEMHIVHVLEDLSMSPAFLSASLVPPPNELREAALLILERQKRSIEMECPQVRVVTHLAHGLPWRRIVQLATDLQTDLVVIGTHDYNAVERFVLGSVAEAVVRKAPCGVLVVRPKKEQRDLRDVADPCAEDAAAPRAESSRVIRPPSRRSS